jgi:hypothetical protein
MLSLADKAGAGSSLPARRQRSMEFGTFMEFPPNAQAGEAAAF